MKLEIVSMVRINGEYVHQEDIPAEEFQKLLEKKLDESMRDIGFERIKTA